MASQESEGASPLSGLAAFREFQAGIGERCEEGPMLSDAEKVGSVGVFYGAR